MEIFYGIVVEYIGLLQTMMLACTVFVLLDMMMQTRVGSSKIAGGLLGVKEGLGELATDRAD
jgi:hypothetical protein